MATQVSEGMLLWEPSEKTKQESNLRKYMQWLEQKRGLHFTGPEELWAWSVDKLEDFWDSLWDYFEIQASRPYKTVLVERKMPGAVAMSVAGGLGTGVVYLLDGAMHNDPYGNDNLPIPFPDALQEFKVETSGLSAQYGMYSGASVNVVTKSGTNNFHGDAFEFNRNPVFNAQNFFATPTTPDRVKRNQFGGTFGGPIIHDKTFFFVDTELLRSREASSGIITVPTSLQRQGIFTEAG